MVDNRAGYIKARGRFQAAETRRIVYFDYLDPPVSFDNQVNAGYIQAGCGSRSGGNPRRGIRKVMHPASRPEVKIGPEFSRGWDQEGPVPLALGRFK